MTRIHSRPTTCWMIAVAFALLATPALAGQPEDDDAFAGEEMRRESPRQSFAGVVSDVWITAKVRTRLIRHPGIAPFAIDVDTQDGFVTLFGSIRAEVDKRDAGRQAMMVSGVKDVQNELQVVSQVAEKQIEKRDGEIRDALEKRLDERDGLGDDDIDVEVANGVVRLTGSVDRSGDRMTALSLARTTQGVRSVVDDLRVQG